MKLKFLLSLGLLSMIAGQAYGQSAAPVEPKKAHFPHSDIFLFDLDLSNQQLPLSQGKNVTQRQGYDNQPHFTADSKSLLFSRGDDYQTDVYEYILESAEIRQITDSPATEFSPTPSDDNTRIAFVSDRNGSIWHGERDNIDNPKWLLEAADNREPVGYFALNPQTQDLFYWSRYGFSMSLLNLQSNTLHFISGNTPPSTPHVIPGTDRFSFVHRQTNGQVWIKSLDPKSRAIEPLIMISGTNFNYSWAPDGSILMVQDDVLYRAVAGGNDGWQQLANLRSLGLENSNRLAVSADGKKLAVVGRSVH